MLLVVQECIFMHCCTTMLFMLARPGRRCQCEDVETAALVLHQCGRVQRAERIMPMAPGALTPWAVGIALRRRASTDALADSWVLIASVILQMRTPSRPSGGSLRHGLYPRGGGRWRARPCTGACSHVFVKSLVRHA